MDETGVTGGICLQSLRAFWKLSRNDILIDVHPYYSTNTYSPATMTFSSNVCHSVKTGPHGLIAEAWSQGLMVGALVVLIMLTIGGMRGGVLLHKLILAEQIMATLHGTYIFAEGPGAGWYVSSTAVILYISYNLHNVINWIKVNPFLGRWSSVAYIGSLVLVWPYWGFEMYLNFAYNNNLGTQYFVHTRPWETFCREPWWLFTTIYLLFVIKRSYECGILELVRASKKFGILLAAMALSIGFIVTDVVTTMVMNSPCAGATPFWKASTVTLGPNSLLTNRSLLWFSNVRQIPYFWMTSNPF